ncbi:hypothetical protein GJ496_009953 [Pomphorhynchus laevis]|nr:hypothetical protein GJ496_009953 [Pomphorhynchus laevis]
MVRRDLNNQVNLNNNLLNQLHDLSKMLSGVEYLRLDYNLIENVYPLFGITNHLRALSLKGNRIRHFDISSYPINWLTYLDLSNNIISAVKIQNMQNLELRFTGNPNDFVLECNTQLILDYNLLVDLHFLSSKPYLNKLKFLSCSHNLIRTINEDFFDSAIKLEKLDLSYNCIKYIPNGFLSNKHTISHVNLSFNMITKVNSRDFLNMLGLQDIGLYGNPITVIPSGFLNLSSQLKSVAISLKHLQCLNIRELSNTIEEIELKSTVLTDWELLHGTTGATTISILRSNVTSMDFLYSVKAPYLADISLSGNIIEELNLNPWFITLATQTAMERYIAEAITLECRYRWKQESDGLLKMMTCLINSKLIILFTASCPTVENTQKNRTLPWLSNNKKSFTACDHSYLDVYQLL